MTYSLVGLEEKLNYISSEYTLEKADNILNETIDNGRIFEIEPWFVLRIAAFSLRNNNKDTNINEADCERKLEEWGKMR